MMKTITLAPPKGLRACGRIRMAAATIKDVARAAKVSVASVSRAMNGGAGVTAATSRRIRAAADRLQYVPHAAARMLSTRRTHTIGALLPHLYGEFFSELIRGIDLAARARGLHLLVSSSHDGLEEAAAAVRSMQGRVDGLLILGGRVDAAFLRANVPEALPVMLLNSAVKSPECNVLNMDNHAGAAAMVRHLLGAGCTSVAFIAGLPDNFDARQREQGCRDAMAESAPQAELIVQAGDFSEQSGYRAGRALLARESHPQAVFAANDLMAVGCLRAFKEAGVRVPQDIALAGFDDISIARYVTPALSTVRMRIADFGRIALERLAASLEHPGEKSPCADTTGFQIVARESCGANIPTFPPGGIIRSQQPAARGGER